MSISPEVQAVLKYSLYLQTQLKRYPQWAAETAYGVGYQIGELKQQALAYFSTATSLAEINHHLRFFRNQQMVRIALRDLLNIATLAEGFRDTSDLADALVQGAMDWHLKGLRERFGTPVGEESGEAQSLLVIGMGKLGGQELNFSSDIDLIYTFPERGMTQGGRDSIDNEMFFTRLTQAMNKSLTEYTEDGFVYRVDMRLRPFGSSGPLVVSFNGMENYYALHGRAWERYALVKARVMVGDVEQGKTLMAILKPFVYRKYVDYTALASLRDLKRQIAEKVRKEGSVSNIKLGPGGIREIEFMVQVFQLIQGGRLPSLQGRSLLPMLEEVAQQGFLSQAVVEKLRLAYVFLRRTENHLQIWNDQQTHHLPRSADELVLLAESIGLTLEDFQQALHQHTEFVQSQFESVFALETGLPEDVETGQTIDNAFDNALERSVETWVTSSQNQALAPLVNQFLALPKVQKLTLEARERLDRVLPLLLAELAHYEAGEQETILVNLLNIVESVLRRSVYLVLLAENKGIIQHLMTVCQTSPWMVEMLVKYPMLLENLADVCGDMNPMSLALYQQEAQALQEKYQDDESFMNQIRQWKHIQVFNVALMDVMGHLPIMKVSDHLTWIAEAVLNACLRYAYCFMVQKHGKPGGVAVFDLDEMPFVVVGYGKLGGLEIGYGSDLDVVFLFDANKQLMSDGKKPLEASLYFLRMGQKLISLMTTMMPTGKLYEIDVRLRPNGNSGQLVVDLPAYQFYMENKAWVWEFQALVRARAVAGGQQIKEAFSDVRKTLLIRPREVDVIRQEVVDMRQKMREGLDTSNLQQFHLKHGQGGVVDIEFMVQFFVLSYAHSFPKLVIYSDNIRLLEGIASVGLLEMEAANNLIDIYQIYRNTYHHLALQNKSKHIENTMFVSERRTVCEIWRKVMQEDLGCGSL